MSSKRANQIISLFFVLIVGACHFTGGFANETPSHAWDATQPCETSACHSR